MNKILENDLQNIEQLLEEGKIQAIDFLNRLSEIPTTPIINTIEYNSLNKFGIGGSNTLVEFSERFGKLINSSTGPRYLGFVTGGSTPAAILGDWLATVYDQNTQAVKGQGDLSANIEIETIKLMLELFDLPQDYLGGFVTGATMSNFTCLAVARQWIGNFLGKDIAKDGLTDKINILAATPHSSSVKSMSMLGLGSKNLIKIQTLENREAIDVNNLEDVIKSLNNQPFILITSGGTVNTVDFDDFIAISKLKEKYNFWWHIDAAFGAFVACVPEYKHIVDGWENADSITIDCHKWLNVPYENATFFIKEKHNNLQVDTFQNSNAPYLGDPLENFNYLNFLPENSRRLKSLPVWFTLKAYGKDGYRDIVKNSIEMANILGEFISNHNSFQLLAPVRFNTVCFTLSDKNQEKIVQFLVQLNATGKVFMTPTNYNGKKGIRAAFVNWRTTEGDLDLIKNLMNTVLEEL